MNPASESEMEGRTELGQPRTNGHSALARAFEPSRAAAWRRALGWFSVGLGLTELLAPRALARGIGLHSQAAALLPVLGARELVSGIGILVKRGQSAPWVQSRVWGDAIDLSLLAAAFTSTRNQRARLLAAMAAVVGVTALDVAFSRRQAGLSTR